ncbi:hypothetical protein Sango_0795300 [Sesamum angolense]|uniref:Uncharacterized protein n=1 Tax=Sesamum angolense TaxID=2727404 RepID=A0AAE2C087_9LAMI|nr:hypothetical protein Sango_0795300 [Sesamum angolense]
MLLPHANWVSCTNSLRSLTGFYVFLGSALVSWETKKQTTASRSIAKAEVEYISMAATVCEFRWISFILKGFGVECFLPVPLYYDNKVVLPIVANPVFHEAH